MQGNVLSYNWGVLTDPGLYPRPLCRGHRFIAVPAVSIGVYDRPEFFLGANNNIDHGNNPPHRRATDRLKRRLMLLRPVRVFRKTADAKRSQIEYPKETIFDWLPPKRRPAPRSIVRTPEST